MHLFYYIYWVQENKNTVVEADILLRLLLVPQPQLKHNAEKRELGWYTAQLLLRLTQCVIFVCLLS